MLWWGMNLFLFARFLLIRLNQSFPKGMELVDITEEQVQEAVERINHRPRKVLGFRTPHEVFFGVEMRYTKQPLAVALRT